MFDPVLADLDRHLSELDRELAPVPCGWCGDPTDPADLKRVQFNSCTQPRTVDACRACIIAEGNDFLTTIFNGPSRLFRRWMRSKRRKK